MILTTVRTIRQEPGVENLREGGPQSFFRSMLDLDPGQVQDSRLRDTPRFQTQVRFPRALRLDPGDPGYPDSRSPSPLDTLTTSGQQQVAYGAAFAGSSTTDYTMPRVTQTAGYDSISARSFTPPQRLMMGAAVGFPAANLQALDIRDPRTGQAQKHENLPFTGHAH